MLEKRLHDIVVDCYLRIWCPICPDKLKDFLACKSNFIMSLSEHSSNIMWYYKTKIADLSFNLDGFLF